MDQLSNSDTPGNAIDDTSDSETEAKNVDFRRGQSSLDVDKDVTKSKATASFQESTEENGRPILECPICLQTCQLPVQLPCRHIFCFLCVKGVVSRSKGCALCRQPIPSDFLCKPNLLFQEELDCSVTFDDGYSWFYEGTDGWWQYDDRTSKELEMHHKAGHPSCELLIAGFVYIIDLNNMVQHRRNDRTKKRRVKRDLLTIQGRKGIAGLKIMTDNLPGPTDRPGADGHETNTNSTGSGQQSIPIRHVNRSSGDHSCSPPTPHNTPQTPMTPSESPPSNGATDDLSGPLHRLRLTDRYIPLSPSAQENSTVSNHGYDSPTFASPSMEDVRASLQQLQSENDSEDSSDVVEDGQNPAASDDSD